MDQPLSFEDAEARAVSIPQAAALLSLAPNTVYKLVNTGELRSFKILGTRRIRVSTIRDYLAQQEATQNQLIQPLPLRKRPGDGT